MVLAAYFLVTGSFLFFATAILGLPADLAGLIMALSTFWDAVTDLPMGWISDHTHSQRYGRRHAYLILGGIGVALCSVFLWSAPRGMSTLATTLWLGAGIFALKTTLTVFVIPHTALGGELTDDYDTRTAVQGYRAVFQILGMLLALVGSNLVFFRSTPAYAQGQLNPHAYAPMGWACAVLVLLATMWTVAGTWRYIPRLRAPRHTARPHWREFLPLLRDRNLRALLLMILAVEIGLQIGIALGVYTYTYTYGLNGPQMGLLALSLLLAAALSQPLWIWMARRLDKKPALVVAAGIAAFGYVMAPFTHVAWSWFPLAPAGHVVLTLMPFQVLAGTGTGAFWSLPYAMAGDCAHAARSPEQTSRAGSYLGLYIFTYKLGSSLSVGLGGLLLGLIGYNPGTSVQTGSTRYGLAMGPAFLLLAVMPFALLALRGYRLDRGRYGTIARAN